MLNCDFIRGSMLLSFNYGGSLDPHYTVCDLYFWCGSKAPPFGLNCYFIWWIHAICFILVDLTWIAWLRDPFASYFVVLFLPAEVFIVLYWSENSCLATFELCIGLISWEYRIPKLCVRIEFKLRLLYCCIGLKVCMKSWALQTFLFVFPNFYGGLSPWFRCFLQYWWACTNR